MNNLKPPGRDERILRALLIERRTAADIARDENVSRARIGQILERLGVKIRPVEFVEDPDKIKALVPEWEPQKESGE